MQFLKDLSMGDITSRLVAALLYAAFQGVVLAGLARLMGDRRPQHDGRLTGNPFAQLSVWGTVVAIVFSVSWIRSLWYDSTSNRFGRAGTIAVVVLGLLASLALLPLIALLQSLAVSLPRTGSYTVLYILNQLQVIAAASTLLNLLPIPGLIGGGVLQALWPERERALKTAEPFCLAVIVALIVAGVAPDLAKLVLPWVRPA